MIIVIADDLSGAAELAGIAHARGFTAEVQTVFDANTNADVIAVDTDTRSGARDHAAQRVREVAQHVLAAAPKWVYKKTDSVLRGHVRTELTSLLAATGLRRALLIPANPSRGRIIERGRYFIKDTPLNETVFARDPEYPATTASVENLLCREDGAEVQLLGPNGELPPAGIAIPDLTASAHLERHAAAFDSRTLYAGAAEFFEALLAARESCGLRISAPCQPMSSGVSVLVCGSAAAWISRRQECISRGIPIFVVDPHAFVAAQPEHSAALSSWAVRTAQALTNVHAGVIALGEPPTHYARSPQLLLKTLSRAVAMVLERVKVDQLFLEGGATAAAVLDEMGWTRLTVVSHFAPDLAAFRVTGREAPLLAIKPGSYAWPERIWPG